MYTVDSEIINGVVVMTNLYRTIELEFGVKRELVVSFSGWLNTDQAINKAKKLKLI